MSRYWQDCIKHFRHHAVLSLLQKHEEENAGKKTRERKRWAEGGRGGRGGRGGGIKIFLFQHSIKYLIVPISIILYLNTASKVNHVYIMRVN